jgi:hypothetical protein
MQISKKKSWGIICVENVTSKMINQKCYIKNKIIKVDSAKYEYLIRQGK